MWSDELYAKMFGHGSLQLWPEWLGMVWYGMVWWEEWLTTIGSFSKYSSTGALYEEVEILDG